MRIAVMGTGGIGGFCGAKLAAKGADVFFIARGEHLNAMQSSGLKLLSALGDVTLTRVTAMDNPVGQAPAAPKLAVSKCRETPLIGCFRSEQLWTRLGRRPC